MKIDTGAFINSLPIMGIGLLGIFIVTAVIIIGIYVLRAITSQKADAEPAVNTEPAVNADAAITEKQKADFSGKKESAMDLMKEREKKDFFKTDNDFTISKDL